MIREILIKLNFRWRSIARAEYLIYKLELIKFSFGVRLEIYLKQLNS